MAKYLLCIGNMGGHGEEVEADFLPRVGDEYFYESTLYFVRGIRHEISRKRQLKSKLEAKVKVLLK